MIRKQQIHSGIYLIIDPSMNEEVLLEKLDCIVNEKIAAIQVWDNFKEDQNIDELLMNIFERTSPRNIPLLINNRWELAMKLPLNGIHFDELPNNLDEIKNSLNKEVILGITCNNKLSAIKKAEENSLDYISFCSMFPSKTANSCELVDFETVQKAKSLFKGKIFLAGGIDLNNIENLSTLSYDGIAVVSGIMSVDNPLESIKNYNLKIKKEKI